VFNTLEIAAFRHLEERSADEPNGSLEPFCAIRAIPAADAGPERPGQAGSRQRRISSRATPYYIDLVFHNRLLRLAIRCTCRPNEELRAVLTRERDEAERVLRAAAG
jgi:hypothetical protein